MWFLTGLDGQRIIIYGGTANFNDPTVTIGGPLYVLDTTNFEWSIPATSGKTPSPRTYHTATVIGKYMVITFGKYNIIIHTHFFFKLLILN